VALLEAAKAERGLAALKKRAKPNVMVRAEVPKRVSPVTRAPPARAD
jgi:hypothetical protein